ncbi:MAG: DUF4019 domain-containing protein [Polymorphobacter sp.]
MADGYHALTEKEKAALRLLLGGHDAKSMATQLGLSVHTVNERLRDARRKLSVSSSKAAARLLREAEAAGATPELLGDRFSGDAGAAPSVQTFEPGLARSPRRAAWTIGGFAMISLFVAALALAASEPAATPVPATTSQIAESDASRAARDWLALVDAQKWPESWAATGESFRTLNTLANWQAAVEQVHARLGPSLSRELASDQEIPAPPNGVRAVRFRTSFANNQGKIETLSLNREDGRWRVVGVYAE